jgi:hypothetical protein
MQIGIAEISPIRDPARVVTAQGHPAIDHGCQFKLSRLASDPRCRNVSSPALTMTRAARRADPCAR